MAKAKKATKKPKTVIGYKGFTQAWKCRDQQYAVGKTVTHKGPVSLCDSGLHFCENPIAVFGYYPPADSNFATVEASGVSPQQDGDSKRVCKQLKITAELSLSGLIAAGVKFILNKVDFSNAPATNTGDQSAATNTGDQSAATNTGYQSAATNTGNRSAATNTGYWSAATNTGNRSAATNTGNWSAATNTGDQSAATNTGKEGCAISIGIAGSAMGAVGCWLTLAEWEERSDGWYRIDVQTRKVDGKEILPDVFYRLVGGKFVAVGM